MSNTANPLKKPLIFVVLLQQINSKSRHLWLEVCKIMRDAPDLRDEFKNFMAPGHGPF